MDKTILSKLYFDGYKIDDIQFQYNHGFNNKDLKLEFDTELDVNIHDTENKGILNIHLLLWDKAEENNYPFRLKVSIVGYFSADKDMDKIQFSEMCKYNGATILFPFLRSAIADITKAANIKPFVLPLINIQHLIGNGNY